MSSGTADSRQDSSPSRAPASDSSSASSSSPNSSAAKDLRWLLLSAAGALLFHFAWTVPSGPFEQSSRNRIRSHEAFLDLSEKYKARSFEDEPKNKGLARPMRFAVKRAVQLARTRLIADGQQVWLGPAKVECRSTRCRFSVCAAKDFPSKAASASTVPEEALHAPLQKALEGFEFSRRRAWKLERVDAPGCPRFEVRFVEFPRSGCLMTLR